jgi:succinyl-CoA synthetase alpha subunit
MSILINSQTRVLVQGITSSFAARQSAGMMKYGTRIVGGVTPGKGGSAVQDVPVYDTVAEATREAPADASVIYVPADKLVDAVVEAIDGGIKLVFVTAEGLPVKDMMYLRALTRESGCWLIGPNSLGVISPGQALMGSFPPEWAMAGKVGVLSRGGTLLLHTCRQLQEGGVGISTAVHVGGDTVLARNPVEYLRAFEADPDTSAVVLLSEVGGGKDHECAEFIRDMHKPVIAFVVGHSVPPGRAMGHAGALVGAANQTAAAKTDALRAAGATIASRPEDIPAILREVLVLRT